jgi:NDP-sugar pyrophosphorylase family protein
MSSRLPPAMILCGGAATRLGPLTANTPKSLLLVNGEPFLAHQLRLLARNSIAKVVLCTGHLGGLIREYAGGGSRFGIEVEYSEDGPRPLGTGGAIRKALPLVGDRFFVLYGDSYLPCDYSRVAAAFSESGQPALMTLYRNDNAHDSSNVEFRDGRIVRYDKQNRSPAMKYIDYGLGMFRKSVFEDREEVPVDLATVYAGLVEHGQVAGLVMKERFYEIGSVAGLQETEDFLRTSLPDDKVRCGGG